MKKLLFLLIGILVACSPLAHAYRDLETGTFLTRDPIGYADGPNVYCYVHCNPITKFDSIGLAGDEKVSKWQVFQAKMAIYTWRIKVALGADPLKTMPLIGGPTAEQAQEEMKNESESMSKVLPSTPGEAAEMAEDPAGFVAKKLEAEAKAQVVKAVVKQINAATGEPVVDEATVEKVLDTADQVAESLNEGQSGQAPASQSANPAGVQPGSESNSESPKRVHNPKHHPNSKSPEPPNVQELYDNSILDKKGYRWAKDSDGTIHRFSKPSNGETHWNGSTATKGTKPIKPDDIPVEVRRELK